MRTVCQSDCDSHDRQIAIIDQLSNRSSVTIDSQGRINFVEINGQTATTHDSHGRVETTIDQFCILQFQTTKQNLSPYNN